MRYLQFFSVLLLCGCSAINNEVDNSEISLFDNHQITYTGSTSIKNADAFEEILNKNANTVDTLVINSNGGDTFGGMRIGRLIHDNDLKVIVHHMCLSSCANYIVTASNEVFVEKGALLGWHGGATQATYTPFGTTEPSLFDKIKNYFSGKDKNKAMDEMLEKWRKDEAQFFKMVDVKQAITILGMMPGYKEQRDAPLFSYDKATLKRLGLKVQFEGEESQFTPDGYKIIQIFNIPSEKLDSLLKLHYKLVHEEKNS